MALAQVIETDQAEQGSEQGERPEPAVLGKKWNAGEGEQQAGGQTGVAGRERVFHGSIADRMTRTRIGKGRARKTKGFGKRLLPARGLCSVAGARQRLSCLRTCTSPGSAVSRRYSSSESSSACSQRVWCGTAAVPVITER